MNKIVILISICAVMNLSSCKSDKKEAVEISEFTVTNPVVKDTTYTKEYIAQIQSLQNVEIRAQEKGYLENLHVDEGHTVKSGQLLFSIMPKLYEAEYLKEKADTKIAEIEYQNTKSLADKNIVSKSELAMAKAKLEEANADLSTAETHLSFTKIKAPFDGIIDRIMYKKGSAIDEGTVLTKISNNASVYAYFNMSEVEYLDYKARAQNDINDKASLLLSNGEKHKYQGKIETIESEFDNNTGNIAFRAKFPNPEFLLKNGQTGKVQLVVPIHNALMIPQKATFEVQDKIYVYVVDAADRVRSRNIVVKQELPNIYIIQSGLSPNDKILIDGIQTVKEEDKIKSKFVPSEQIFNHLELIKQ